MSESAAPFGSARDASEARRRDDIESPRRAPLVFIGHSAGATGPPDDHLGLETGLDEPLDDLLRETPLGGVTDFVSRLHAAVDVWAAGSPPP